MINKENKNQIIQKFKQHEQDTGSVEVQVALLTKEIELLTEHCKKFNKDFSSKRGLLKKVSQRKSFLNYLSRKDAQKYKDLLASLELRK